MRACMSAGVQHLFAVASKWTSFWRARLDRVLFVAVGYLVMQPCGCRALLATSGVMHALTLYLDAPTDEVRCAVQFPKQHTPQPP